MKVLAFTILFLTTAADFTVFSTQPEQIHIAYGDDPRSEMTVSWATRELTGDPSIVHYGRSAPDMVALATTRLFVDGGKRKASQYIHTVRIRGLEPGTRYRYRCGSGDKLSELFSFLTADESEPGSWSDVRLAAFGDLGLKNSRALEHLAGRTEYQALLHLGDIAYDLHSKNGAIGDMFMNLIQPIAANIPYMVCPGNHEKAYNFSHYRGRFAMPGQSENLYYSYNLGPVHFISLNTEAYYFLEYGIKLLTNQYDWLEQDLKEANEYENRLLRPWIVAYGHKPMYCSNGNKKDCTRKFCKTRVGFQDYGGLEKLFYEYGVDLALWGHQHSYERLWPLYDYQVMNGSKEQPYVNPKATVHITSGTAGSKEKTYLYKKERPDWSALRSSAYGYLDLHFLNGSHLHIQQINSDDGTIVDEFWMVKEEPNTFARRSYKHQWKQVLRQFGKSLKWKSQLLVNIVSQFTKWLSADILLTTISVPLYKENSQ